ncbi:MAG: hypothetical protein L6W00_22865 [Lentisphaeria bacterium]|nr:MAG: hypothetical protein L6W00_22865 [Lentisphaeria bacterium]
MRKIRIGQIGIGHNHASEKMAALRRLSDFYEVVGVVEEDDSWWSRRGGLQVYQGIPRLTEEELSTPPGWRRSRWKPTASNSWRRRVAASSGILPSTWINPAGRSSNRSASC